MNQFEHWHDLHRQEHAERAQAQRPESSPLRGSSRRSVYLALLSVGVLLLVGGYFAFTSEETATYGWVEQLAADLSEGGIPCETDSPARGVGVQGVGVCRSVGVTLTVFETASDLDAAVHPGGIARLVGANWVVAPAVPDADIDDELHRIQDIVGGTITPD